MCEEGSLKVTNLIVLAVVLVLAGGVVGVKSLFSKAPADADSPPVEDLVVKAPGRVVLFNRDNGCACVLKLYQWADHYFEQIDPELATAFGAQRFNLYYAEDLAARYGIRLAPTLLVLDASGAVVLRQESKLDVDRVEAKLRELLAAEGGR